MENEFHIIARPGKGEHLDIPIENQNSIQRTTPSKRRTEHSEDDETNGVTLAPGDYLAGTPFKAPTIEDDPYSDELDVRRYNWIRQYKNLRSPAEVRLPEIRLSSRDVTRWKMAWQAMRVFGIPEYIRDDTKCGGTNAITLRCKNWPDAIAEDLSVVLGFSTAACTYGGLHAVAWFAHFKSSTEQLLWRISVCLVMSGLPVLYVLWKVVSNWEPTREVLPSEEENYFIRKVKRFLTIAFLENKIYEG